MHFLHMWAQNIYHDKDLNKKNVSGGIKPPKLLLIIFTALIFLFLPSSTGQLSKQIHSCGHAVAEVCINMYPIRIKNKYARNL